MADLRKPEFPEIPSAEQLQDPQQYAAFLEAATAWVLAEVAALQQRPAPSPGIRLRLKQVIRVNSA